MQFLTWVLSFLSGPVVQGVVDAYKAKLASVNQADEHAVTLAVADLQAQIEARKAAVSLASTPLWRVQAFGGFIAVSYLAKAVFWDKVVGSFFGCYGKTEPGTCGLFQTDPITGDVATWVALIIAMYFGGTIISHVTDKVAARFGK